MLMRAENLSLPNDIAGYSSPSTPTISATGLRLRKNIINLEYQPSGQCYDLIHLAVEKYIDNYSENNTVEQTKIYDTILFLINSGYKNNGKIEFT